MTTNNNGTARLASNNAMLTVENVKTMSLQELAMLAQFPGKAKAEVVRAARIRVQEIQKADRKADQGTKERHAFTNATVSFGVGQSGVLLENGLRSGPFSMYAQEFLSILASGEDGLVYLEQHFVDQTEGKLKADNEGKVRKISLGKPLDGTEKAEVVIENKLRTKAILAVIGDENVRKAAKVLHDVIHTVVQGVRAKAAAAAQTTAPTAEETETLEGLDLDVEDTTDAADQE